MDRYQTTAANISFVITFVMLGYGSSPLSCSLLLKKNHRKLSGKKTAQCTKSHTTKRNRTFFWFGLKTKTLDPKDLNTDKKG